MEAVDSAALLAAARRFDGPALNVWIVMRTSRDPEHHFARSQSEIARFLGKSLPTIQRAVRELKTAGVLKVVRETEGATVFEVGDLESDEHGGFRVAERPIISVTSNLTQPSSLRHLSHQTEQPASNPIIPSRLTQPNAIEPSNLTHPARARAKNSPLRLTNSESEQQQQQPKPAAAAGKAVGEAEQARLDALAIAGVAEPTLSRLAKVETLKPERIREIASAGKAAGKGPGAIVRNIEADLIRADALARRKQAQAPRVEAARDALKQHDAADAQIQADEKAIDDFSGPILREIVEALVLGLPVNHRRTIAARADAAGAVGLFDRARHMARHPLIRGQVAQTLRDRQSGAPRVVPEPQFATA